MFIFQQSPGTRDNVTSINLMKDQEGFFFRVMDLPVQSIYVWKEQSNEQTFITNGLIKKLLSKNTHKNRKSVYENKAKKET